MDAPDANEGALGVGGARLPLLVVGERGLECVALDGEGELPIVVLRCILIVSAEGGGGRCERLSWERMEARQRKHSPVP